MATIKAYTDFLQSNVLATILPPESADMCYLQKNGQAKTISPSKLNEILNVSKPQVIPCWSLAALLGVLPNMISRYFKILGWCYSEWGCAYMDEDGEIKYNSIADNPVDACYDLILKLHELKML